MRAAVLTSPEKISEHPLRIEQVLQPSARDGQVLLRVRACGVCRTDLHIVEGELTRLSERLIPGHQIVGEIVEGATPLSGLTESQLPPVAVAVKARPAPPFSESV